MKSEKFLEFNGKKLTLVNADGKFFVAIKPICEALNVHYKTQHRVISEDNILSQLSSIQRTTGADSKQYNMLCLPEKYIYGWLFSINSESEDLKKYKLECYDILYNHFHNILAVRHADLDNRTALREEYHQLHIKKLAQDDDYKKMVEIQQKVKAINKNLAEYDNILLNGQLRLEL